MTLKELGNLKKSKQYSGGNMKNIPKIIYLNQDYLGVVEEDDFDKAQWTWCTDKIDNRDIKYITYNDYLDKVEKLNRKLKSYLGRIRNDSKRNVKRP